MPRVCGIKNAHSVPEWTPKDSPKKTGRAARKVNQVRLDYSLIHKSIPQRRPSSLTAASFKYGQKCRKCSGRNVMNPDGFKKFKHDCPCCRLCFRQNMSVCIQHHASRIPPGTPEATGNDGNKQVSLIITKSHQVPRRKTKHGYILLTATQKKGLQGSGQE